MFGRFDTIPACDRQTHTDRHSQTHDDGIYSPGARESYPALRVKVFFFADSGSPEGRLQFPGG